MLLLNPALVLKSFSEEDDDNCDDEQRDKLHSCWCSCSIQPQSNAGCILLIPVCSELWGYTFKITSNEKYNDDDEGSDFNNDYFYIQGIDYADDHDDWEHKILRDSFVNGCQKCLKVRDRYDYDSVPTILCICFIILHI